ncbi:MAG: LamG-like jellyroll fold domain-containing protein [Thermoplasmatota archaeon]
MRIYHYLLMTAIVISGIHLTFGSEAVNADLPGASVFGGDPDMWSDDFNNDTKIYKMDKNDNALNGPAFEFLNGMLIPGSVYGLGTVDSSTVALWHFDEGAGTKVNDSSPNRKHGTMVNMNSADWVAGINGTALDFDGSNDNVKVPWSSVLNLNRVTVEAWIYPHKVAGSFDTGAFIIHKRSGYFMMTAEFTIETPSVVYAISRAAVKNQWNYMVGTFDGTTVRFYINGELKATTTSSLGMSNTNNPLFMGAYDGGSYISYPFDGLIDEVKLSNKAISTKDVKNNYDSYFAWKNGYRNTDVYVQSEKIEIPSNHYWKEINVTKICPGASVINVSVIDGKTGAFIPGYTNLTSSSIDISGLDPMKYPSIRLQANFTSDGGDYPELDRWTVSWRENVSPSVVDVETPEIVVRTEGSYLTVRVDDLDQPAGSLTVNVFSSSRDHTKWTGYAVGDVVYDQENSSFNVSFDPAEGYDLGRYSFKVRVTDYLGAQDEVVLLNSTLVYSERKLNFTLVQQGIDATRKEYTNLTLLPDLDGPLDEVNLSVKILYEGSEVDWFTKPILEEGKWEFRIIPPMEADLGHYNISLEAESINFFPFPLIIEDAFVIVNRIPIIEEIPMIVLDEDDPTGSLLDLSALIDDIETPKENMEVEVVHQSDPDNISVEIVGKELFLTLLRENWYGEASIVVSLSDDYDTVTGEVDIRVDPVQDITVLEPVSDLSVMEDESLEYRFNATDVDPSDVISYDLDTGDLKDLVRDYSFDRYSGVMNFTATNDAVGIHECNISVSDGTDTVWEPFLIEIVNVNDPPVWESVGGKSVERSDLSFKLDQDSALDIELVGSDIDDADENMTYTLVSGPDFGMIDGDILRLSPIWSDVGDHVFVINLSDHEYSVPVEMTVQVIDIPDEPVAVIVEAEGPVMDDENVILDGSGSYDPDEGDEMSFTWRSNISGNIGYEPIVNVTLEPGLHNISLTVRDGRSLTSTSYFEILVMKSPDPVAEDDDDEIIDDDGNETSSGGGSLIPVVVGAAAGILILLLIGGAVVFLIVRSKGSGTEDVEKEGEDPNGEVAPGTVPPDPAREDAAAPQVPPAPPQAQVQAPPEHAALPQADQHPAAVPRQPPGIPPQTASPPPQVQPAAVPQTAAPPVQPPQQ